MLFFKKIPSTEIHNNIYIIVIYEEPTRVCYLSIIYPICRKVVLKRYISYYGFKIVSIYLVFSTTPASGDTVWGAPGASDQHFGPSFKFSKFRNTKTKGKKNN